MAAGALKKTKVWRSPRLIERRGRVGHWYTLSSAPGEPSAEIIVLEPVHPEEPLETAPPAPEALRGPGTRSRH